MGQFKKWYKRAAWQRRREHQLRVQPLCQMCAQRGLVVEATSVDHVTAHRGDYNAFVMGELQSLCEVCANRTKQQIEVVGYSRDIGADGWPTDPRHPANAR
jgi:hypothetical protein